MDLCIGNYRMHLMKQTDHISNNADLKEKLIESQKEDKEKRAQHIKKVTEKVKKSLKNAEKIMNESGKNVVEAATDKELIEMMKILSTDEVSLSSPVIPNPRRDSLKRTEFEDDSEIYSQVMKVNRRKSVRQIKSMVDKVVASRKETTEIEQQHENNQKIYNGKFETMKFVCKGNTKARIDQFEGL